MNFKEVIVEIGPNHVAEVTLHRPEHLNTFSTTMASELYDALTGLDGDKNVRVILVKGSGKAFCAGIDVKELEGKTPMEYREWIEHMETPLVTRAGRI